MAELRILLSPPDVGKVERDALLDAFDSNWIAPAGPHLSSFEEAFAAYTEAEAAVAVSSGTAAIHLALLLHGVGVGDEVVVPTLTFVATANPVSYVGATAVFVDSDEATWTLCPDLLAETLRAKAETGTLPAAVLAVDIYGQCADYDRLAEVCAPYDIPVIADAAESLGASYQGKPSGAIADMSCFSFNGNKIITTSGGGMITGSASLVDKARYLASQARQPVPHYEHTEVGFNYRMSNLLAALGEAQLSGLDARMSLRKQIRDRYVETLQGNPHVRSFMPTAGYGEPNGWLTVAQLEGRDPESVCAQMAERGVEVRRAWKPMHMQPLFDQNERVLNGVSEAIYESGICLPSGSGLSEEDQTFVIDSLADVLEHS